MRDEGRGGSECLSLSAPSSPPRFWRRLRWHDGWCLFRVRVRVRARARVRVRVRVRVRGA